MLRDARFQRGKLLNARRSFCRGLPAAPFRQSLRDWLCRSTTFYLAARGQSRTGIVVARNRAIVEQHRKTVLCEDTSVLRSRSTLLALLLFSFFAFVFKFQDFAVGGDVGLGAFAVWECEFGFVDFLAVLVIDGDFLEGGLFLVLLDDGLDGGRAFRERDLFVFREGKGGPCGDGDG